MTTATTDSTTDQALILSETDGNVGIIRLNRPKVLNALNPELMRQMFQVMDAWDRDDQVHVILLTGSDKAFAAGADIGDMAQQSTVGANGTPADGATIS